MNNKKNVGKTYVIDGQRKTADEVLALLNSSMSQLQEDSRVVNTLDLIE